MVFKKQTEIMESRKTRMGKLYISGDKKGLTFLHSDGTNLVEHLIHVDKGILGKYKVHLNQFLFQDEKMLSKRWRGYDDYARNPEVHSDMIKSLESVVASLKKKPINGLTDKEHTKLVFALDEELKTMKNALIKP